jgi:hypothetical protein
MCIEVPYCKIREKRVASESVQPLLQQCESHRQVITGNLKQIYDNGLGKLETLQLYS